MNKNNSVTMGAAQPPETSKSWQHPTEVMKLHGSLKRKKRALQVRLNSTNNSGNCSEPSINTNATLKQYSLYSVVNGLKRPNPFLTEKANSSSSSKSSRLSSLSLDDISSSSTDTTLFEQLFHSTVNTTKGNQTMTNASNDTEGYLSEGPDLEQSNCLGTTWFPTDWALKTKLRIMSQTPLPWSQTLKVSEEASGIVGFVRCLSSAKQHTANLDMAPNARLHQSCLYWQHPSLPWLTLFPRVNSREPSSDSAATAAAATVQLPASVRSDLYAAWLDSFRSLLQLLKTKQCPYFYMCANSFNVLFRAAGIAGFRDIHALVTPTTSGFRRLLRHERIEFSMPLNRCTTTVMSNEEDDEQRIDHEVNAQLVDFEDEALEDDWFTKMGIGAELVKRINSSQERIQHKAESRIDNSRESLILVQGVEVNGLYNFLINCKTITATTGTLAGIPPTLLAPVAFAGATLNALKLKQSRAHVDNTDVYFLDVNGPILPSNVHSVVQNFPREKCLSVQFTAYAPTQPFNAVKPTAVPSSDTAYIFGKENLADCGLNDTILKQFCMSNDKYVSSLNCLKCDSGLYTWDSIPE